MSPGCNPAVTKLLTEAVIAGTHGQKSRRGTTLFKQLSQIKSHLNLGLFRQTKPENIHNLVILKTQKLKQGPRYYQDSSRLHAHSRQHSKILTVTSTLISSSCSMMARFCQAFQAPASLIFSSHCNPFSITQLRRYHILTSSRGFQNPILEHGVFRFTGKCCNCFASCIVE